MVKQRIEDTSFIVIDFETVTPKGRPPEPIELAILSIEPSLRISSRMKRTWLIRPPDGAPITPFDTAQTGIRWEDVKDAPTVSSVLGELEGIVGDGEYVFVAQNARYEAAIVRRFNEVCRHVAGVPFVDTISLAKQSVPGLDNFRLDTISLHLGLPRPAQRHRAMPDVELTAEVFLRLLKIGNHSGGISTIQQLLEIAGIEKRERPAQGSLFDI